MAAAASHGSPSPVSERRNPNHRTQESMCSLRRSFNGNPTARPSISSVPRGYNPVTPANSPADFPRRNSISKDGVPTVRSSYEKENERDRSISKPMRMKSPVASTGTKNFMAPTISAASKATPSPRKKVLTERNETVRTSLTSPGEGKSPFPCMNSSEFKEAKEIGSKLDMGIDSLVLSDTPKPLKASSQQRNVEFECNEQMDASCLPVLPSPEIGQSLPPYDPETNYLSPRPMFLHYKPNPRIELYLNKEKDLDPGEDDKRPEDSFTSSCSDDTEPTEETQSPNIETESNCSLSFDSGDEVDEETSAESDGVEEIHRSHSFPRPKSFFSFLLVLAVVCLSISVTDSPGPLSSSLIKNQPFDKLYVPALQVLEDPFLRDSITEISEIANANFKRAVHNFRRLSIKCLANIFHAVSLPRDEHANVFQFSNQTARVSDISENKITADTNPIKDCREIEMKESGLHREAEVTMGQAASQKHGEIEEAIDETATIALEEEEVDQAAEGEHFNLQFYAKETSEKEVPEEPISLVHEEQTSAISEAPTTEPAFMETDETQKNFNINSQADVDIMHEEISGNAKSLTGIETNSSSLGAAEDEFEMQKKMAPTAEPALMETDETREEFNICSEANIDLMDEEISGDANSGAEIETPQSPETSSAGHGAVEDEFQMQKTLAISFTLLGVVVAAVFSRPKHKKMESAEGPEIRNAVAKEMDSASVSASSDNGPCFDQTPLNGQSEVEMLGKSGPYEVSSNLQMSSSHGPWRSERGEVEVQSYQRRGRRSSSYSCSESPSYGSFTAYEKLPNKQGCGDDEAMTPVRRSSRLRKQITSP